MAKKPARKSPSDVFDEAVRASPTSHDWFRVMPAEDREWFEQLLEIYTSKPIRPSLTKLREKASEVIELPVSRTAFNDFVNRWMTEHGKKNAG